MTHYARNRHIAPMKCSLALACCATALLCDADGAASDRNANEIIAERGAIFTYLLDTGASSSTCLPATAIDDKPAWLILDEEDTTHTFAGDAILLNDKIAVVLRRGGPGAEAYARRAAGHVRRGVLAPRCADGDQVKGLLSLEIIENQTGAVSVRGTFDTVQGNTFSLDYRLTTGQVFVEVQPHEGVDALKVDVPAEYIVVPDFFGDDLVYAPQTFKRTTVGLPAENFYMHLVDDGNSVVTCLWQSNRRNARLLVSGAGEGTVSSRGRSSEDTVKAAVTSEIECVDGKTLWVAFTECPRVWHSRATSPSAMGSGLPLDWAPPFPAKWRASFFESSEVAASSDFLGQSPEVDGGTSTPLTCACWFDAGRPMVRCRDAASPVAPESSAPPSPLTVVTYPIDRSQDTPLDVYCLVDLMRGTLGVGACQYILDVEGLDAQTSPTPALVMDWVEKQFEKKKDARYADAIRDRCRLMVEHIGHAEQRIVRYKEFAAEVRKLASAGKPESPSCQGALSILDDLDQGVSQTAALRATPEAAAALAQQVVDLAGKDGAYEECRRIGALLRAQGGAQDRALSKCRMAVRRLKQYSLTAMEDDPAAADFMRPILAQTDDILRDKQASQ